MTLVERTVSSCKVGGSAEVFFEYDDVTLTVSRIFTRGKTNARASVRITRGPAELHIINAPSQTESEWKIPTPLQFELVERVNHLGDTNLGFPDGLNIYCSWTIRPRPV